MAFSQLIYWVCPKYDDAYFVADNIIWKRCDTEFWKNEIKHNTNPHLIGDARHAVAEIDGWGGNNIKTQ